MKNWKHSIFFCAILGVKANDPNEWIKYVNSQVRGESSSALMSMSIKTEDWSRTLKIKALASGKDKSLITILSPAKEKGIRTLRLNRNMWNYFPKLKRKIIVSSSMLLSSWMGSDFTNDDILKASHLQSDYNHKFGEDKKIDGTSYKKIINTIKKDSTAMWPKIISYLSKEDCLPRYYHYIDKNDETKRILSFKNIKTFDGHQVPSVWTMYPQDDVNKSTRLEYQNLKFDTKFPNGTFSIRNLTSPTKL